MLSEKSLLSFVSDLLLQNAWSLSHAERITRIARTYDRWAGPQVRLGDLDENRLNQWLRELEAGRSATTVLSYRRHLLLIWFAAAREGLSPPNVYRIRKPRSLPTRPVAWLLDDVQSLLSAAERTTGTIGEIDESLFWPAIIRVAYDTGLRLGDVLSLQLDQISTNPTWIVQHKTRQSKIISVHQSTLEAVQATVPPDRHLAFPLPFLRRQFYLRFRALVQLAGLSGTFKRLRCTSGSYVERDNPGLGSQHLGHKTPGIFTKHYEDVSITKTRLLLPPEIVLS